MDQKIVDGFLKQAAATPVYKQYLPFLKLARDCFAQNPIITYWALCYVLETALKNQAKPTEEFRKFLMDIMACLEKEKKARIANGDSKFANEKEAKTFIEEYGNKLLEKAEENEELYDKLDLAYKLYLSASSIFQIYTCFVRDDEENAKRIKFCKWKAVECFKKKKELDENPPKLGDTEFVESNEESKPQDEPGESSSSQPGACPYPNQSGQPGVCPYPSASGGSLPYPNISGNSNLFPSASQPNITDSSASEPNLNLPEIPSDPEPPKQPTPPANDPPKALKPAATDTKPDQCNNKTDDPAILLQRNLAALKLSDSDSKRAELLCESALYAIRAQDLLTAVDTLKQTLDLLLKRAKK